MKKFHLEKGDSSDIGFASTSLVVGAITFSEFKEWLYYVIEHSEEVPTYFFDIIDLEKKSDYVSRRRDYLGFGPGWNSTKDEFKALDGIGYKRFKDFRSDASSREEALNALAKNPHVEQKFRESFPFIEL